RRLHLRRTQSRPHPGRGARARRADQAGHHRRKDQGAEHVVIRLSGIDKSFGAVRANRGASLEVATGEVHALVGENGAGKSTLMKILSGAEKPDAGLMELDGAPYQPSGPQEARLRGVAMIYQELALAPHLDVETNVMLGLEE